MTDAGVDAPRLAPEKLDELRWLLEGSDSVELKLTVPDGDQRSAVRALDLDPLSAEIRQVFFLDTPDLTLNQQGVILRVRRTKKSDDSVVKLRPAVPSEFSSDLRSMDGFAVEVDAMPGGFVCSATLGAKMRPGKVKEAVGAERALRSLFTKAQRAFHEQSAPGAVPIDELSILGPITVLKLKFSPKGYNGRLVAELWTYPDGSRILELSTKASPSDAFETAARARRFLEKRGVVLTGEQQTKTKTALEFFSAEMR